MGSIFLSDKSVNISKSYIFIQPWFNRFSVARSFMKSHFILLVVKISIKNERYLILIEPFFCLQFLENF